MALKRIGEFIGSDSVVETEARLPKVNVLDRFNDALGDTASKFSGAIQKVGESGYNLYSDIKKRGQNVYEQAVQTGEDLSKTSAFTSSLSPEFQQPKGLGEKAIDVASLGGKVVGEVGGAVGDMFTRFFEAATSNVTPEQKEALIQSKPVQDIKAAFAKENINPEILATIDSISQKAKENPEVASAVGDFFNVLLNVTGGGAAESTLKKVGEKTAGALGDIAASATDVAEDVVGGIKSGTTGALKATENIVGDAYRSASGLRDNVQTIIAEKSVNPQLKSSAERLFVDGTKRLEDPITTYDKYVKQAKQATKDIKVDPPVSIVGEKVGDAFNSVVKQRRSVGEVMGNELKKIGNLKADVSETFTNLETALKESGARYNASTGKLVLDKTSKFTAEDKFILESYVKELNKLGANPTIAQIDGLLSRTQGLVDNYKSSKGITQVTNGERLIKQSQNILRNQFDPVKTGNPQLKAYSDARKAYADLSNFIDEGSGYLGKITQTGDFAKDASLAKSSVQSVLNNGKKDWLLRLEALTGYQALDEAVLALQAMKDAGDFRGTSLLQVISEGNVPLTPSGFTQKVLDFAVEKGKNILAGTPEEQTRAYLTSLSKTVANSKPKKVLKPKNQINSLKDNPTMGQIALTQNFKSLDDMLVSAVESKKYIDNVAKEIADSTGNRVAFTDIKTKESATRKLSEPDVMGNHNNLKDLARNTIVLDKPESYETIVSDLKKRFHKVRVKKQKPESFMGYEGTIVNILTPSGLISEIQITSPKMIFGKMLPETSLSILGKDEFAKIAKETGLKPGEGHLIYEEFRQLPIAEQEGFVGKALIDKSNKYYAKLR